MCRDSPGVPASANAHELFRGFSFVAPCLLEEDRSRSQQTNHSTENLKSSLVNKPCAFTEEYELLGVLGRGTFSVCRLCEHKASKKQYAVKVGIDSFVIEKSFYLFVLFNFVDYR